MPLAGTGNTLGSTIASAVTGLSAANKADPEKIWQEVAKAIVAHIVANAVVSTTGTAAAQTGTVA